MDSPSQTHTYYNEQELRELLALAELGMRMDELVRAERERIARLLMETDFDSDLGSSTAYEAGKLLLDGADNFEELTRVASLLRYARQMRDYALRDRNLATTLTNARDAKQLHSNADDYEQRAQRYEDEARALGAQI